MFNSLALPRHNLAPRPSSVHDDWKHWCSFTAYSQLSWLDENAQNHLYVSCGTCSVCFVLSWSTCLGHTTSSSCHNLSFHRFSMYFFLSSFLLCLVSRTTATPQSYPPPSLHVFLWCCWDLCTPSRNASVSPRYPANTVDTIPFLPGTISNTISRYFFCTWTRLRSWSCLSINLLLFSSLLRIF